MRDGPPRLRRTRSSGRSLVLAAALSGAILGSAACESGADTSKPATALAPVARRIDVEMRDFAFSPTSFEASQGRIFNITATNAGAAAHTLNVYRDAAFTVPLAPDAHIEVPPGAVEGLFVKFDDAATYYYRCEIHPQLMQGQVSVRPSF